MPITPSSIDINCDMGESFGRYTLGHDEALLPLITSANIACGLHAGDPRVMEQTVRLARDAHVAIGAHPGLPDLQGFGRRRLDLAPEEAEAFILYQIGALAAFTRALGTELTHVKPHGALYNQAAQDRELGRAIARGVARFSRRLILVGLAGSALVEAGVEAGLAVANEGFPERGYTPAGTLLPRRLPGALIETPEQAAEQAWRLAQEGVSLTTALGTLRVPIDTLCVHGDNPNAVQILHAIRARLSQNGRAVAALAAAPDEGA
jgi:5-oxoprolinase (ATP-hydrolysing) subunit A